MCINFGFLPSFKQLWNTAFTKERKSNLVPLHNSYSQQFKVKSYMPLSFWLAPLSGVKCIVTIILCNRCAQTEWMFLVKCHARFSVSCINSWGPVWQPLLPVSTKNQSITVYGARQLQVTVVSENRQTFAQ